MRPTFTKDFANTSKDIRIWNNQAKRRVSTSLHITDLLTVNKQQEMFSTVNNCLDEGFQQIRRPRDATTNSEDFSSKLY